MEMLDIKEGLLKRGITQLFSMLLGMVFIFSGFVKLVDPMGGMIKITDYLNAFHFPELGSFFSNYLSQISLILAFNLAAFEFTLGVCLLLGIYRKYISFLTLLFMLFMTPLTLYLALFNPVSDCGCFGDAIILTNWQTFYKNIVLLFLSLWVFFYNQKIFQFYSYKTYWLIVIYIYLGGLGFAYYNYQHLPLLDFRPYKIGANIPQMMEIPEDAPQDQYELIYEKNGVRKCFTVENYPKEDTTWVFIESKLKQKGYKPEVESFDILDNDGNLVSDEILYSPNPIWLLIMPDVKNADSEHIVEISDVYDYALEHQMQFLGITGSSKNEIQRWLDYTGGEYPVLSADQVLLKTIIRSNPGLILLQEGTILGKWHFNDFPNDETVNEVVKMALSGKYIENEEQEARRLLTDLLTFSVPLLLIWVYDIIRYRRKRKYVNEK